MTNKLSWHTERTSFGYNHKGDESNFEKTYKSLIKESAQNSLDALDTNSKKEFKNEFVLCYLSILPVCDRCHSVFLTFKLKECASVSPV